jgi:hypothetical protein
LLKGGHVKRIVLLIVVAAVFMIGNTASAEDGFKLFLGYGGGHEKSKVNTDAFGDAYKTSGNVHGPSLDATYEAGPLFVRGSFNYYWASGAKEKLTNIGIDEYIWSIEGDFGYKAYSKNNISLTPYLGFGYRDWEFKSKSFDLKVKATSPYAAVGVNTVYAGEHWSAGLDLALLIPFAGKIEETGTASIFNDSFNQEVSVSARVQVPLTYAAIPKKGNSFGLLVFATPYYEYWSLGESSKKMSVAVTPVQSLFGIKGGIGFVF